MATKKKKESIADQIINGTYEPRLTLKNALDKGNSIVDRVQQRANNIMNKSSNINLLATREPQKNTTNLSSFKDKIIGINNQNMQRAGLKPINSNNSQIPFLMNKNKNVEETKENVPQNPLQWKETRKLADVSKGLPNAKDVSDETLYRISNIKDRLERDRAISGTVKSKKEQDKLRVKVNSLVQERETSEKANKINNRLEMAKTIDQLTGNKLNLEKTATDLEGTKRFGAGLGQGALNFGLDIAGTMQSLSPRSDDSFVNATKQLASKNSQLNSKIKNPIVSGAGRAGETIGFMIPSIVASAVAPESNMSGIVNAVGVGGSSYLENLNEEQTNKLESLLTGVAKGTVSYKIEQLSDGNFLSKGKSSLSKEQVKGLSNISNNMVRWFKSKATEIGGEVAEENLENVAGYIIDYLINDKKITADELIQEAKQTSVDTFTTTALLNVLGLGGKTYRQSQQYETSRNLLSNTNLDNTAKDIILNDVLEGKRTSNDVFYLLYGHSDTELNNQIIDNSKMDENSKQAMKKVAEENELGINEIQYLIDNTLQGKYAQNQSTTMQNKEVSQNNQQVVRTDTKTAQNGNMGQTEQSIQNYLKNASENGADVQNKTVKSIYEVTQRRGIVAEYNADVFKDKNGKVDENKNAVWTIDDNGNRKVIINPKADTKMTLQNIMVHELTHDFEGSKEYEILSKLALDKMKTQEGYLKGREDLEGIYSKVYDKNSENFQTLVDQEAVADFLGENLGNQEFINELVNSQPRTTIQKIYDWVVDKIAKVTGNEKLYWKNVEQKFKNAYNSKNENSSQDSKYSIAGRKAIENLKSNPSYYKQAIDMYKLAKKMAKQGEKNSKIIKETGWFKDDTGKLKFSFSDKDMDLKNVKFKENKTYNLEDVVEHDALFLLYPQLRSYKVKFEDMNKNKNSKDGTLHGSYNRLSKIIKLDINRARIKQDAEGTLIHEIQHAIQDIEGFTGGTSRKLGKKQYEKNLGEIEARDTTKRFIEEKYEQHDLSNVIPESAKLDRNMLEKMKDGLYNYLNKFSKGVSYEEIDGKDKTLIRQNRDMVVGRVNENNVENSNKSSFSMPKLKEKQLEIINKSNPMLDDYHLGIRSIEDIKTFDEVINDDESFVYGDFSKEDAEKALKDGKVTVYSSKPIEQGNFVSTSKNMAQDYAGRNGKVYSQEVSLNDVAWINGDEGQYAKVDNTKYSYQSNGAWNNFLKKHSINKGTGETMQQVKLPQMPIEQFQKVLDTAQHIPQEEKNYLLETVKDIKRNKTSLEDFKNTIETMEKAYNEQNENILDTKKTYNTGRKETYQKYMKANTEYDSSSLENAKNIVPANHQGRRTKAQWLTIAKQMGTEIANKSNAEIEEIAYRTWQDERPSNKDSLNRQGEKFVQFTSDEWINTIYDAVKEQREKYSIDTGESNSFDEDLQAIREASQKGLGDTMTVNEQIEAIEKLNSNELDNKLPDTSLKIVDKLSKEKTPFKEKVAKVRKLITNKGAFVDDLFKATGNKQGIWKYDRYLGSFSEGQVSVGVRQINSDGVVVGDSLLDIYDNAKKEGITQKILDDYVLNKDNISRSKYEKYIFGEEISARDSQRIIDEYDKKYPQLKEYAKQVSNFADNNTKGYLVGTFISQDLYNKLRQMYPDHVPVVRDILETPGLAEYDNVGAQVLKRATGGNQEILSPKEALAQQSVTYARAFRRNEALKEVYKSLKSDTKVLYDLGQIIDMEQANDCIKNAIGYDDTLKKYTATIFENGEAKVFEISKDIFDAFNNDTLFDKIDRRLEKSLPGKVLKKGTETFKGLTTGKNILYALKNMARDINDAPINSTTNFANYMRDWAYAYEQIVTDGKYYQEYVNAGGNSNTFYDYSKGLLKKDFSSLPKKAINFINNQTIGRVEQINEVVETAPRLAEFIATRQRGGSIDEALYNSAEVTTNFKRGGELSKLIDKYGVPYLNASIQGLSKVYRNVSEAKGFKQYARLAVNATLAGVLPSVINHLVYEDDDDYEELPDYLKDGYYLIKVTDLPNGMKDQLKKWTENNFVRIPKGRISAVLGGTVVRLHETINNEGEDVWNGYMSDVVLNNIGINNPLTNNLFSGLKQAMRNEAWYGGSIYSESKYKNKLPVEITDEKTTQLSNWIAETVYNMVGKEKYKQLVDKENGNAFFKVLATPKLLDYAMDQYSGIVGDIVMPMLTPYAENDPLTDQFTTSSTLKSTSVSKFYEILGNCYQNSEYATDTDKLTYKYLEEVSKDVGSMYAEKSAVQSDTTLTNKQKQQKTYEIQEQINQKMKEAINNVENMKLTSNTASFNGTEYYKDEEGKWKEVTEKNKIEGLSTETYADYKSKISKATQTKKETDGEDAQLTNKERLSVLKNSAYTDKEKDTIYTQTTGKKDDTYFNLKLINGNDISKIDDYLDYKIADIKGDEDEKSNKKNATISGSKKKNVIEYINNSNFNEFESLYLYGKLYKFSNSERNKFIKYMEDSNLSEEEKIKIYSDIKKNVEEWNDGSYHWK